MRVRGGVDAHRPAGFRQRPALAEPGALLQAQGLRVLHRVGDVGVDLVALRRAQRSTGMEAPILAGGEDHHAVVVYHQQLLRGIAPEPFDVFEIDLHHQHADDPRAFLHRAGEVVAALDRGGAQAEEARQAALHGLAIIGAEGEVAVDETVRLGPVGGDLGGAVRLQQVDHVGAGASADVGQRLVGDLLQQRVARLLQGLAQHRQAAEDLRQFFVAAQRAEQVGDVEVERLAVLLGQLLAVVALGEILQGPEQRREKQGEDDQRAPAMEIGFQDERTCRGCEYPGHPGRDALNYHALRRVRSLPAVQGKQSASANVLPWRSFSESRGASCSGQSIFSSGSFQTMQRSCSGAQKSVVL